MHDLLKADSSVAPRSCCPTGRTAATISLPWRGAAVMAAGWVVLAAAAIAGAEDWPMYRHDRLRTAVTGEKLSLPLEQAWVLKSRFTDSVPKPDYEPLWAPYPDCSRYNLPMIAVGDSLIYGSPAEGRVVCLDAATSRIRWQFVAGGSVNRTPVYWEGHVYCGSNDGNVYCLDAKTGAVAWTHRAVDKPRWLISYGTPISAWPVMTDVMVDGGIAYYSAGVFPHDGTFVDAIDAKTRALKWRHGRVSENGWRDSLAPGGHLFVTQNHVWVPKDFRGYSGIAYGSGIPFRRADGKYAGGWGGPDPEGPNTRGAFWPLVGVVKDGVRYCGTIAWKAENEDQKRETIWQQEVPGRWVDIDSAIGVRLGGKHGLPVVLRYDPDLCTVVYAGGTVFHTAFDASPAKGVGSGLYARDPKDGKVLWSAELPERANSIVVANGRLFVGTRNGTIYCFAPAGVARHGVRQEQEVLPQDPPRPEIVSAVERIVEHSGVKEGYAVVLDCEEGRLPLELALRTKLHVCAVFNDADAMAKARRMYVDAGGHLSRIITCLQSPDGKLPCPSFFADLVVSEAAALGKSLPNNVEELTRVTKPIRGINLFGGAVGSEALNAWTKKTGQPGWQVVDAKGPWAKRIRPELAESGSWTHMYADPGNTTCSHDGALKPPLGVLWYGAPFIRYGTKQIPLIVGGILVNPDAHSLEGFDQYTGRRLWRVEANHIGAGAGQIAASPKHLFVKYGNVLAQFDLLTGKELAAFRTPYGEKHGWGWFAVGADGKVVYGAAAGGVFALEMESGQGNVVWNLGGPDSEEKYSASLMSDGRIYMLGGAAKPEQRAEVLADLKKWFQTQPVELREEFESQLDKRDIRELVAIDAATGKVLYRKGMDISNCGGNWLRPNGFGSRRGYNPHLFLDLYAHNGVVVAASGGGADKGWSVWFTGAYNNRAITAYDGATGKLLWYRFANYRSRPLIVDNTIHAEPWAYDLRTGERKTRPHPVTGEPTDWAWWRADKQCGIFSASKHFLFGRAMGLAYQDLLTDQGLYTFWHSRASCWIDCSSGGGLMIKPPQSLGCVCQWNMPFTIALGHVSTPPTAAPTFAAPGADLPVKHLCLDFGATGDRRDAEGNLWMRPHLVPGHPLGLGYGMASLLYEKNDITERSAHYTPIDSERVPFVFATAQIGLKRCVLPITTAEHGAGSFVVRLGFSAPPGDQPGQRVFDVKLGGRTVLADFDIVKETGRPDTALWKEFTLENINGDIVLDLVAKSGTDDLARLPLINAVEVIRKEFKTLGLKTPEGVWLNRATPQKTATLALANLSGEPFNGKLSFESPPGIAVTPVSAEAHGLVVNSGSRAELTFTIAAQASVPAGRHLIVAKVLGADGKVLLARSFPVDELDNLVRHELRGQSRSVEVEPLQKALDTLSRPNYHGASLHLAEGSAAAASYLTFPIPPELHGRIRQARLRLHLADGQRHLRHAALESPGEPKPTTPADLGVVKQLQGPPWPNIGEVKLAARPATQPESLPLKPVDWAADVVEAAVPGTIKTDAQNSNLYLVLEPTSAAGATYCGATAELSKSAVLLVDAEPK